MSFFDNLRQKASIFDKIAESFSPVLTRDEKFKLEYKLPPGEIIVDETNADISFVGVYSKARDIQRAGSKQDQAVAVIYSGKLYLTPHFLVFKDAFDENSCVLVTNISAIKRVERTPSESHSFSLTMVLYNGTEILIQFLGLRYRSEQFSQQLKHYLKINVEKAKQLPEFLVTCYSEFIITKNILRKKDLVAPRAGLGQQFKYPGNPSMEKEKAKLRMWFDYFKEYGQNLAIMKNYMFQKLVRVGLPSRIRGEIWELCSGAIYLRHANDGEYRRLLQENEGKSSQAIDEIEKDLKRSLPEYRAFQQEEGIVRLRNVLTAYSWKNPDVGYCQAMNIVTAGLLIYMTEEQAFWCLSNLCDLYVPGYYSKTMYGTLLDQKVFEALVAEHIPELWDHITKYDIQLSVVSLPWFLSLFFTSMPLEYALRIIDIFFLNGAKTLFQVALAVLKSNMDELLAAEEDGTFVAVLKQYFQSLGESAHADSSDLKYRQITKFQNLLVTAFKDFNVLTETLIIQERQKYQKDILHNIETFVKKTQLRQMPKTFHLQNDELASIYDIYYQCIETHKISMGTGSANMTFEVFPQFLSRFCDWLTPVSNGSDPNYEKQRTQFLEKLFKAWDVCNVGELTLNDVVKGFDQLRTNDLLELINYFFSLYDSDNDGELLQEEVLQVSEGLLFLTEPWKSGKYVDLLTKKSIEDDIAEKIIEENENNEVNPDNVVLPIGVEIDEEKYKMEQTERYLKAASNFLQRSFEYAKSLEIEAEIDLIDLSDDDENFQIKKKKYDHMKANAALDPTHPKVIDLATFRMIILADETYELFFSKTWRNSIHIDESINIDAAKNKALRGMFDGIIADGRRVAEQVRRRVDSAATRTSGSTEIFTNQTVHSSAMTSSLSKEEGLEDMDDFTHEHQEEHEQLLKNVWAEMDMDNEDYSEPERQALLNVPKQSSDDVHKDLIEFEA